MSFRCVCAARYAGNIAGLSWHALTFTMHCMLLNLVIPPLAEHGDQLHHLDRPMLTNTGHHVWELQSECRIESATGLGWSLPENKRGFGAKH